MRRGRLVFEGLLILALAFTLFAWRVEVLEVRDAAPFLPPMLFLSEKDWIQVQGTWRRDDGDDAYPIQTTTIECYRSTMQCVEASTVLLRGNVMQGISIDRFKVLRWDDDLINTEGVGARCVKAVYEFHLSTKRVTGLQTRKNDAPCNASAAISNAETETRLHMVDGYEDSWARRR